MSEIMTQLNETAKPQPFTPDEAWIESFAKQNTIEMREAAKRYATRRARYICNAGGHVDEFDIRALVQDALTDTLLGEVTWDPAKKPLEQHILDTLQYRTRNAKKRAERYSHHRIDVFDKRSTGTRAMGEIESSLRADQEGTSAEDLVFANQVIARLRGLAANDPLVLRLVDAIAEGATEPADIMSVAKFSRKHYRNARERLDRLVQNLDNDINDDLRS